MTITIRLDPKLQKELDLYARREGMTRSELVRECIQEYIAQKKQRATAWELGQDLFGKHASDRSDLERIAALIGQYADLPMDFADASLVAICERLGVRSVATLDSDFHVYRLEGKDAFQNVFPVI